MAAYKGKIEGIHSCISMLYHRDGVDFNIEEAIKYCKMGADLGDPVSLNSYGSVLQDGEGVEVNKEVAIKYY